MAKVILRAIRYFQLVLYCIPVIGTSQTVDLTQTITFRFTNVKLEKVLSSIGQQYQIPFAYSRDFIPIHQRISIEVVQLPLKVGLDRLFEPTKIVYTVIGNSIALGIDKNKEVILPVSFQSPKPDTPPSEKLEPPLKKKERNYAKLPALKKENYGLLFRYRLIDQPILDSLKNIGLFVRDDIPNIYDDSPYREMSQVTFVPPISTNQDKADSITNTFSLNILYGVNGGVEGIEVGGFGNITLHNMKGLQVSGLLNKVYGRMSGTQFAGALNHNVGYTRGLQFTLGVNHTNETKAIQMAGLMNFVEGDFAGLQAAIVGNYIRKRGSGIQMALLFNKAKADIQKQFAVVYNEAGEVHKVQAGLINKANYVKGTQYGIINIAEEMNGTPIGLLNFIKKGYNRIEVAGSESLFANFGFKFGKRKFYNILQFGYRFTNDIWSIGYGIGTGWHLGKAQHIHVEWITSHINEGTWWTRNTNWLHQFRCSYDWRFGKKETSLFIGPVLYWSVSTIRPSEEEGFTGSNLPSYTFLDNNTTNSNWKMWLGATAGLRF